MQDRSFSALNLSPEILKAVTALGFEEASPIQAAAIPLLRQGKDVVGQSQTGSGKTAAFAIPAIESVDAAKRTVQVLILCPTRELATQVAEEVHKLSAFKRGVHAVPIYGGASYDRQFYELKKGVQIVIGTPGRLMDHLDRKTLSLADIRMVVLDEADRMLDMGFRDDIQCILDQAPAERQTAFFSATVSPQIQQLIKRYSRNPESIRAEQKSVTAPTVEQVYYEVPSRAKQDSLIRLIDFHQYKLGIIFCNTQRMVDDLADALQAQGISADRLHGGIPQAQRTRVMNKFKNAEFEFLVATDVAGRGIDVDDLEVVVNYDLPYDPEDYVHRIGRTGRAGREGMAVTFVSGRELFKIPQFERFTKTRIRRDRIPTLDQIEERRVDIVFQQVEATLESGAFKSQSDFVERLLDLGYSSTDIASAILHQLLRDDSDSDTIVHYEARAKSPSPAKPATAALAAEKVQKTSIPQPAAPAPAIEPAAIVPSAAPEPQETKCKPIDKLPAPLKPVSPADVQESQTTVQQPVKPVAPEPALPEPKAPQSAAPAAPAAPMPEQPIATPKAVKPSVQTVSTSQPQARPHKAKQAKETPLRSEPKLEWVVLNAGRDDGLTPKDVVDMLATESDIPPRCIGRIDMTDHAAYAQVPKEHVAKMAETVSRLEFDGRQLTLQTAAFSGGAQDAKPRKKSTSAKPYRH